VISYELHLLYMLLAEQRSLHIITQKMKDGYGARRGVDGRDRGGLEAGYYIQSPVDNCYMLLSLIGTAFQR